MNRQFLNLVVEKCRNGLYSLRRIKVEPHLFYPSTAAAESAMSRTEAAIKANAKRRVGYLDGLRSLRARATSLGRLPLPWINFEPAGPTFGDEVSLDFVALLGDESRILCGDSYGRTCLYDADAHAVLTVPSLRGIKGGDAIPITLSRRSAAGGSHEHDDMFRPVYDTLYVMARTPDSCHADYLFEQLNYGDQILFSEFSPAHHWTTLPPPPFIYHPTYELPVDIGAYTVVGSTIYVSSTAPGLGTYSFDTVTRKWKHVGKWMLPFFGKAEYVPGLNLWFGLSASRPFHLCAADLSALHSQGPPTVLHTWVDLDMPKSWSPFQLDLVNLGCGRFCIVKIFHCTSPPLDLGFSDGEENHGDEDEALLDVTDIISWEFAVLTGVEVVPSCPDGLKMIKHRSRFHIFQDHSIRWVL